MESNSAEQETATLGTVILIMVGHRLMVNAANFAGHKTCIGTQFGNCCSIIGYCGNLSHYCSGSNCYSGAFVSLEILLDNQ